MSPLQPNSISVYYYLPIGESIYMISSSSPKCFERVTWARLPPSAPRLFRLEALCEAMYTLGSLGDVVPVPTRTLQVLPGFGGPVTFSPSVSALLACLGSPTASFALTDSSPRPRLSLTSLAGSLLRLLLLGLCSCSPPSHVPCLLLAAALRLFVLVPGSPQHFVLLTCPRLLVSAQPLCFAVLSWTTFLSASASLPCYFLALLLHLFVATHLSASTSLRRGLVCGSSFLLGTPTATLPSFLATILFMFMVLATALVFPLRRRLPYFLASLCCSFVATFSLFLSSLLPLCLGV